MRLSGKWKREEYYSKLYGGGQMFPLQLKSLNSYTNICCKAVESIPPSVIFIYSLFLRFSLEMVEIITMQFYYRD